MRSFNIKNIIAVLTLGFVVVLGSGQLANAQNSDWRNRQEQQRIAREQAAEQERIRLEQQRNNTDPAWYNNGRYNTNSRYRVTRNGRNYNTDGRGAELLRQAVNQGYQQGYTAGRSDRSSRRRSSYSNQSMYRSGNYGYDSHVNRGQYQYYFQQGFQRGYQDGYNSRNRYGSNNGGSVNILSSILGSILNIQSY
jgi:hypothetical protein